MGVASPFPSANFVHLHETEVGKPKPDGSGRNLLPFFIKTKSPKLHLGAFSIQCKMIKAISAKETYPIRHQEMWPNKPFAFVKLPEDAKGYHWGFFLDGELVSIISLFVAGEAAQFRKFATKKAYQGQGYGSRLLLHLIQEAKRMGVKRLWCNARVDKTGFYTRFGLDETTVTFEKEGQAYVVMEGCLKD